VSSIFKNVVKAPVKNVVKNVFLSKVTNGSGNGGESLFDVSLLTYDLVSLDTSPDVSGNAKGSNFSPDGTLFYASGGWPDDQIGQYALGTAFDLSTASLDAVVDIGVLYVSAFVSSDGNKFIGLRSNSVFQTHSLLTPFDINTESYDGTASQYSAISEDNSAQAGYITPDGSKAFMVGTESDSIHQYSFGTAFIPNTLSYDNIAFSLAAQETIPTALAFTSDGLTLLVSGYSSETIYQYDLTSPFDLNTVSYSGKSFAVAEATNLIEHLIIGDSDTKVYVHQRGGVIFQYSVGT
jgi:hypothetical protein